MAVGSTEAPIGTPGPVSYEHEGFTVRSNSGTVADLQSDLGVETPDPNTTSEDTADPGDEDPEVTPAPKVKAQDKHDRIQQLTYEREQSKREAAEAKAEVERLKAERAQPVERDEPRRTDDEQARYEAWKAGNDESDPKPQVAKFDDHDEYLDARDAWNERRFERRGERAQQERQHHERQQGMRQAATAFQGRMDAEVAKDPGFKQILDRVQIPQGPILDVFLSTDIPEAMARHLDSNPDVLQSMIRMRPGQQLAAIKKLEGRLEAQLESRQGAATTGSAPAVKPTTKAHPPINPVVGAHVAASSDPPGDDASDEEYYAYYDRNGNPRKR